MRTRLRRCVVACALAALAVVASGALAGCGGEAAQPSQPPPPAPKPVPTINPVSSVKYQRILIDLDRELSSSFQGIGPAATPADLAAALRSAASAVDVQSGVLRKLTAPASAESAHADLLAALASLGANLTSLATDADDQNICTGGTGVPRVSRSSGAAALRSVVRALDEAHPGAGFRVGAFLPASADDPIRRPGNGDLIAGRRGGLGELVISNGRDAEAVVKVVAGGQVVRQVYVQANSDVTVGSIPNGNYEIYLTTGGDWDGARFTRDCTFRKFDEPAVFTTTPIPGGTEYRIVTIQLLRPGTPTSGGATSSPVDPEEFPVS